MNLSWTKSNADTVANYILLRSSAADALAPYDSVAATDSTYTDENLTNGTTYYYGLRIKSTNGFYGEIYTASATPNISAPNNFTATGGANQVTLNWDAATGVARTLIYQGTSSGNLTLVDSTSDGSTATATITGLTSATVYFLSLIHI